MRRFLLFCVFLFSPFAAHADTVVLTGKPPFQRVRVTGFDRGRIAFRGLSGETIRRPITTVDRIELDDCPALNDAERAADDKNWDGAKAAYERAASEAREPWLRDLARARLLDSLQRGGRFVDACRTFVRMQHDGHAAAIEPPRLPATASASDVEMALQVVSDALSEPGLSGGSQAVLRGLSLELIVASAAAIPDRWTPFAPTSAPAAPATAESNDTDSDEPPPLMFTGAQPTPTSGPTVDIVQLRPGTPVLDFLSADLDRSTTGSSRGAVAVDPQKRADSLEKSLLFFADVDRPRASLLLGRALIDAEQPAEAASRLLALATATNDRDLSASAMYYVGLAHERLDRPEVAADVYRELLAREDLPTDIRKRASERAARLK